MKFIKKTRKSNNDFTIYIILYGFIQRIKFCSFSDKIIRHNLENPTNLHTHLLEWSSLTDFTEPEKKEINTLNLF